MPFIVVCVTAPIIFMTFICLKFIISAIIISKALRFLKITAEHQDCQSYTEFPNKNITPKYIDNAVLDFAQTSRTSRQLLEEKSPANDFGKTPILSAEKCDFK